MNSHWIPRTSFHPAETPPARDALPPSQGDSLHAPALFAAGKEIYAQGETCGNVYKIEFGGVRIYRLLADGRRQISAFHLAGETFGFEADNTHHFFAEAICATGVWILRPKSVREDLAVELFPIALQGLIRAQEHLLVIGRQNAVERMAVFLLEMSERQSGMPRIELLMPRTDIADYLGLTIETVSRVLSKLKQKGIIRLPTLHSVEIVKRQALQEMTA